MTQPYLAFLAHFTPHQTFSKQSHHVSFSLYFITVQSSVHANKLFHHFGTNGVHCWVVAYSLSYSAHSSFSGKHSYINSSYPFSPHNLQYHVVLSFLHIIPDSLGSKRYMDLLFLARLALSDGYLETHCTYSSLHTFTSYKRKRLQLTACSFSSADPSFHAPSPSRQTHITTSTGISFSAAASDLICINQHSIINVKHVALADCTATWLRR